VEQLSSSALTTQILEVNSDDIMKRVPLTSVAGLRIESKAFQEFIGGAVTNTSARVSSVVAKLRPAILYQRHRACTTLHKDKC